MKDLNQAAKVLKDAGFEVIILKSLETLQVKLNRRVSRNEVFRVLEKFGLADEVRKVTDAVSGGYRFQFFID